MSFPSINCLQSQLNNPHSLKTWHWHDKDLLFCTLVHAATMNNRAAESSTSVRLNSTLILRIEQAWMCFCVFRWEVTFCWMKKGRSFSLTRVKAQWTGRLWRPSCGPPALPAAPPTQQSNVQIREHWRHLSSSGGFLLLFLPHHWHHRGRAALWLTFMTSRLTFMTPWRNVADAELWIKYKMIFSWWCQCCEGSIF